MHWLHNLAKYRWKSQFKQTTSVTPTKRAVNIICLQRLVKGNDQVWTKPTGGEQGCSHFVFRPQQIWSDHTCGSEFSPFFLFHRQIIATLATTVPQEKLNERARLDNNNQRAPREKLKDLVWCNKSPNRMVFLGFLSSALKTQLREKSNWGSQDRLYSPTSARIIISQH